ncbi:flagellar export protein FliJ [Dechloromonas agitata]|uniref:flagellar export protein FliJ n=1 Tax=Dechloromonas agitata TaxID=73030 RepID=UPI0004890CF5|nr:flagellar export protein FliJ [Dechloromonas agitata]MDE1547402.1 flagellar export protein FliJ [Dechloromonas agitata]
MAQPFSLQPLLELMQTRTDEATRTLGKLIAAEQSQRSRLQMLEQYREEYAQRLRDSIAQGITRLVMLNYQEFLARIDEAIEQQRIVVQNSELSTKAGQEQWKAQNRQLKAIDTLSQRHDARQRYRENRQEQKLQDEFTTRKFGPPAPSDGSDD